MILQFESLGEPGDGQCTRGPACLGETDCCTGSAQRDRMSALSFPPWSAPSPLDSHVPHLLTCPSTDTEPTEYPTRQASHRPPTSHQVNTSRIMYLRRTTARVPSYHRLPKRLPRGENRPGADLKEDRFLGRLPAHSSIVPPMGLEAGALSSKTSSWVHYTQPYQSSGWCPDFAHATGSQDPVRFGPPSQSSYWCPSGVQCPLPHILPERGRPQPDSRHAPLKKHSVFQRDPTLGDCRGKTVTTQDTRKSRWGSQASGGNERGAPSTSTPDGARGAWMLQRDRRQVEHEKPKPAKPEGRGTHKHRPPPRP